MIDIHKNVIRYVIFINYTVDKQINVLKFPP